MFNNILGDDNFEPIKIGSSGELVELLQQELKYLGLFNHNVDGIYGEDTASSVKQFQMVRKLPVTGRVDYNSWEKIYDAAVEQGYNPSFNSKQNYPILRYNDTSEYVTILQEMLTNIGFKRGDIDGWFGPVTLEAVKDFQRATGLPITGIVDKYTWDMLIKAQRIEDNIYYTVKRGDTLYTLAKNNCTTVSAIMKANKITNSDLFVGQKLIIPNECNYNAQKKVHIVKPGDTLYTLAKTYGTSVDAIKRANDMKNDLLSIGQVLIIP